MSTPWSRLRSALEFPIRQRVTRGGLLFTLAILVIGVAAVVSANNLLFLVVAAMLSMLLVSGFICRLSLAGLELDILLPDQITARRKVAARVAVRNLKRAMPSFSISLAGEGDSVFSSPLYFPVIAGGATIEETVEVCFGRRGPHRENSFRFSTGFPFGFLERGIRVRLPREALVYPSIDPQPGFEELLAGIAGEVEAYYRGRGNDFYRIRPYEAMESARYVDWKATAHTGELQVREFAREQEHIIEIFLDLQVPDDLRDWFEQAVECCAFLAWRVTRRGARVRFRTQEFDMVVPNEGDVYAVLKYLALVSPTHRRLPVSSDADNIYQVVFTAAPGKLEESGWTPARTVSPESA
jgi:uncharacterized protein (DUF58 family)